ncbi:hypothetical protein RN001_005952 [Aquatica leii]|uniref:SWIM-type domain-containing protein n=1 Tax=Aquatica leii TaxID=1421715 RepID=A0AAN7QKN8_9COLE|nr:hypothetical protein RN001_005952 [Aquatica leii]
MGRIGERVMGIIEVSGTGILSLKDSDCDNLIGAEIIFINNESTHSEVSAVPTTSASTVMINGNNISEEQNYTLSINLFISMAASSSTDFVQAQSDNLPHVDIFMVMQYIASSDCYTAAEIKGIKALHSMRAKYINAAVGYVQPERCGDLCKIVAQICPEHKIRSKNYGVHMEVDEKEEEVRYVTCQDCPASGGGCKHALALLMWVHEKSTQPATTEIECYWKKPKLTEIGNKRKFINTSDFGREAHFNVPGASTFMSQFMDAVKEAVPKPQVQLLKYYDEANNLTKLSLHHLFINFGKNQSTADFLMYASTNMLASVCQHTERATIEQQKSQLWYEIRYGRITASKLYAAAHCQKSEGVLVEQILGACKFKLTQAMKRGQILEKEVLKELEQSIKKKIQKVGLLVTGDHPELGASPDGLCEDTVIEIKCPSAAKTFKNYLTKDKQIVAKYKAQIQLQMLLFKRKNGIFCVADPNFEQTRQVTIVQTTLDEMYINDLITKAKLFWKNCIYPILLSSVK